MGRVRVINGRILNCRPSFKSHKVPRYQVQIENLPPVVDLRAKMPEVYDQGTMGSCSGNALAAAVQFLHPEIMPSRLFIYWNERVYENDPAEDAGATTLLDGCNSLMIKGVCPEDEWPYLQQNLLKCPTSMAFKDALTHQITDFSRAQNHLGIFMGLAEGFPVTVAIPIYESFMSKAIERTGLVPMPSDDEEMVGGHAVLAVGYDMSEKMFLVRNSWGADWGLSGYFKIPFSYIETMGSDFFIIKK